MQTKQSNDSNLIFMMGEELKKPLTAIKALSESNQDGSEKAISLEAQRALRTIDNIVLLQQLSSEQISLNLMPIHIGSTLTQVSDYLQPLSLERGCETEVFIQSNISTVDVDKQVLKSGIESLWQALLGLTSRPSPLTWSVYRTKNGIRISVVNNSVDLSKVSFSKANNFNKYSKQPIAGVAGSATDLLTARGLFELMGSGIRKVRKDGNSGLAVTLPVSDQLALV